MNQDQFCVQTLLNDGADWEVKGDEGYKILKMLVKAGMSDAIKSVVSSGANEFKVDEYGNNLLHIAS